MNEAKHCGTKTIGTVAVEGFGVQVKELKLRSAESSQSAVRDVHIFRLGSYVF